MYPYVNAPNVKLFLFPVLLPARTDDIMYIEKEPRLKNNLQEGMNIMKKILALLVALMMVMLCVPVTAVETEDWDPVGTDISAVHAAYLTAGGNPSTTNFLTAEDFASHVITFINVWSDGCGPCVAEMPYFQQVHEEYGDQGVLVVGCCSLWINGSYSGEWNHLQNNGYTYMNVIQDSVLQSLYSHNNYVPQTFIVNSEGIVIDFIGGGTTYNNLVNKIGYWLGVYSDNYYDVDFVNGVTGEIFATQSVHAGYIPVYPEPPEVEGYTFSSWDPASPPIITGPTTITANYIIKTYRVRFYDSITGEKIATRYAQHGGAVPNVPAPPEHEGFVFVGWDHDITCVTEAMDVYTIYAVNGDIQTGDANGDGELTTTDALLILRYAMSLETIPDALLDYCDVDGNGVINTSDALALLRIVLFG